MRLLLMLSKPIRVLDSSWPDVPARNAGRDTQWETQHTALVCFHMRVCFKTLPRPHNHTLQLWEPSVCCLL